MRETCGCSAVPFSESQLVRTDITLTAFSLAQMSWTKLYIHDTRIRYCPERNTPLTPPSHPSLPQVGRWHFCAHNFTDDELIVAATMMFNHALSMPELEPWRIPTGACHAFLLSVIYGLGLVCLLPQSADRLPLVSSISSLSGLPLF